MNTNILLSYLLIFGGIVVWGLLLPDRKKVSQGVMNAITVFGGAFLLASCFINLVPHLYLHGFYTPGYHIKIGAAVLVGFLIQLILESITNGVEHGHNHCLECHESHFHPVTGLLLGLSIHAFLEGMPLVDSDGDIHQSLLYGIVLHNIPIALVLVGIFAHNGYSTLKSLALLSLFAAMTPLGSLCNIFFVSDNDTMQAIIMGIVVGILLHVSVSILFDQGEEENKRSIWLRILLIIIAFIAAYLTPGCPEIYG